MKRFRLERAAQLEFDDAAAWYESEREGLGFEFIDEIDRTLTRIETQDTFATAPLVRLEHGVVRREFVHRFPYVVIFVETETDRRVIMIRRGNVDPARWRRRL